MIVVKCTEADREALHGVAIDAKELKDDGTDYLDIRISKPWGSEKELYRDNIVSIWWLMIKPFQNTSMHCHPHKQTILYVVGGRCVLDTLSKSWQLSGGDLVLIEKGAFHRTTAGENCCVLYELEQPPNKRDLVRLYDSYGRGQGYEHAGMEPSEELPST